MRAWRIVHKKYLTSAFSGEGARMAGGRWNSEGFPMVYTAESLSLAMLEMIVHLESREALYLYKAIPVSIPDGLLTELDIATLPDDWNGPLPHPVTQRTGNRWVKDLSSVALSVPSAVIPIEFNILLNPLHPDFAKLEIGEAIDLPVDARIFDKLS